MGIRTQTREASRLEDILNITGLAGNSSQGCNTDDATKPHILVVEDDRSLAEWVCEYLNDQGFMVTLATRGDDAIHLIKTDQPDMVVLDVILPASNGLDVCRSVRPLYAGPI